MPITDKLRSYQVAHRKTMSTAEHRQNKHLNNRCEKSRQPTRQRERAMKGSTLSVQCNGFCPFPVGFPALSTARHRVNSTEHPTDMATRFQVWNQVTEQAVAACPTTPCGGVLRP